jgi:2-oxo-4-hydroxy-4-carboxy-5-ureidoimidazoline decarboxylase
MAEPHAVLNDLTDGEAGAALTRCCGSTRWVQAMLARRPFASTPALYADAEAAWAALGRDDFLEAFAHHPRIGARATDAFSKQEQSGAVDADAAVKRALLEANEEYLRRFGYIFIVCATGKSAAEMLGSLRARLDNDPARELTIAAGEQARITRLRLEKLGR